MVVRDLLFLGGHFVPKQKRPKDSPNHKSTKRPIEQYDHKGKTRVNNPPVGLVTPQTDPPAPTHKTYEYDPHLDPQLVWAGKKEHTSFEVPTVSLHVHERIDPRTIIEAVRKRNGVPLKPAQGYLFETREENPPLREAVDFYRHAHGWTNRLIAGDSLLVMNSLLEKEGLAGQVQMVYIDPPYGIRYGSNFQPFVNRRDVKDGKDEDLTQEPEMVRAFRDTWELGIHSYLTYLRDRLLLARDILHESGSCFVQISDENIHHVRGLLDEVFGIDNFFAQITFAKTSGFAASGLPSVADYLLWYAKSKEKVKFRPLYLKRSVKTIGEQFRFLEVSPSKVVKLTKDQIAGREEIPSGVRFAANDLTSPGESGEKYSVRFGEREYWPNPGTHWRTTKDGIETLRELNRLFAVGDRLAWKRTESDFPFVVLNNNWPDTAQGGMALDKIYVVQTVETTIERCILMTTDPGDIVFDPTCGSGTTAFVAEQWGRRWITCDTSRVATTLAKQRLMGATFDYYKLAHPSEGVGSGFEYKKVPHVTLKSIANNEPPGEETLYDQPLTDNSRARISGPFTVEAVPAPNVKSLDDLGPSSSRPAPPPTVVIPSLRGVIPNEREGSAFSSSSPSPADASIARSGPTLRQSDWRDELLKSGLRGKGGQMIHFSRVEPLGGTRWLHADAETKNGKPERVVISFGPDYAPLVTTQVEMAWEEARTLHPKPEILVFAAFQFDPEAAKDIDDLTKEKTGMTFLTAQMNADLLTDDLKKKRSSSQSFWLVGRPDVDLRQIKSGEDKGKYQAEVRGFDYYNTRTGTIESGDTTKIAMWLLDTDYDGRSLYPRQVFFPLADEDEGWAKLARNLKAEIDPDLIEHYRGTVSLPFALGDHKRVAVKVIDDRGIESLKVLQL
jgi:adenine-specific DNA-methyltransferase